MHPFLLYGGIIALMFLIGFSIYTLNEKWHRPRSLAAKAHGWQYESRGNNARFRLSGVAEGIHWHLLPPRPRRSTRLLWTTQTQISSKHAITIRPKGFSDSSAFDMEFSRHSMRGILKRIHMIQQGQPPPVQTLTVVGSESFQRRFHVWGSEETAVFHYLNQSIQQKLLAWTEKYAKRTWPEINIAPFGIFIAFTAQLTADQMVEIVTLGEMFIGRYKASGGVL